MKSDIEKITYLTKYNVNNIYSERIHNNSVQSNSTVMHSKFTLLHECK